MKDKTPDTDKQYFRAITKRLNASIPIAGLSKSDLDEMIIAMREIDPQLHTNVENLSKYHAPPESLPVNTNKCPWGISNKRPLVSSVFKTNDA